MCYNTRRESDSFSEMEYHCVGGKMGNRNNRKSGTEDDRRPYIIIAIAACAVILIAFGILLGHKLTKKDTPEETKKETTTTVTPEETKEKGVWLLSKEYPYLYGKPYLGREFSYDELGRMTQMTTYEADGSVSETEYYSYDLNGTRTECWIPAKGGECQIISLEDITGENISVRPYAGETYEEEFYKDGYIKEFRIYRDTEEFPGGPSKKTLAENASDCSDDSSAHSSVCKRQK